MKLRLLNMLAMAWGALAWGNGKIGSGSFGISLGGEVIYAHPSQFGYGKLLINGQAAGFQGQTYQLLKCHVDENNKPIQFGCRGLAGRKGDIDFAVTGTLNRELEVPAGIYIALYYGYSEPFEVRRGQTTTISLKALKVDFPKIPYTLGWNDGVKLKFHSDWSRKEMQEHYVNTVWLDGGSGDNVHSFCDESLPFCHIFEEGDPLKMIGNVLFFDGKADAYRSILFTGRGEYKVVENVETYQAPYFVRGNNYIEVYHEDLGSFMISGPAALKKVFGRSVTMAVFPGIYGIKSELWHTPVGISYTPFVLPWSLANRMKPFFKLSGLKTEE